MCRSAPSRTRNSEQVWSGKKTAKEALDAIVEAVATQLLARFEVVQEGKPNASRPYRECSKNSGR